MKPANLFLLFVFLLSSCAPIATVIPTPTTIPSTNTPLPPTVTPTLAPENLADASDLPTWIEQYVNAYGGKVTINGTEMDASQLTNVIKANPNSFTQVKQVNGIEYSFLVVNDVPLAINNNQTTWEAIGLKDLGNMVNIEIGDSLAWKTKDNTEIHDPRYFSILERNYSVITLAQGIYWKWFEPEHNGAIDQWSLYDIKSQIAILKNINPLFTIRVQPLLFAANNPDWLSSLTAEEQKSAIEKHIQDVYDTLTKLNVQPTEWVVVNEPYFKGSGWVREDSLYDKLGYDYIPFSFQSARNILGSNAILIYNDTANNSSSQTEYSYYTDLTKQNVERIKQTGINNIAVGLQMHLTGAVPPNETDLIATMQSYGLPVYITELDVDMSGIRENQQQIIQSSIFATVFRAAIKSGVCKGISFWNGVDIYSYPEDYLGKPDSNPTLFNDNFEPKQSYYTVLKELFTFIENK